MLKIIAAVACNMVIGRGDVLPWELPDDLVRFKEITKGKIVAQGSRTFHSIIAKIGKPLPGRRNIVLTRSPKSPEFYGLETTEWWQSIAKRGEREEIFVIGGAEVYRLLLPYTEEMYLTRVHANAEGDILFPEWDKREWKKTQSEPHVKGHLNQFDFTFEKFERISGLHRL